MSREEDPARDAHLQAALRHAPDGQVNVPPLLRARIVAAAQRSAEASRQQRPWWRRLDAGWNPWRMGGAGTAAAALLAATVLWVGRDEQPAAHDPRPLPETHPTRQITTGTRPSPALPASTTAPATGSPPAPAGPRAGDSGPSNPPGGAPLPPAPPAASPPRAPDRKVEAARDMATASRAGAAHGSDTPAAAAAGGANRTAETAAETAAARAAERDRAAAQATEQRSAESLRRIVPPAQPSQPAVATATPPSPAPAAERPTPFVDAAPQAAPRPAPPRRESPPADAAAPVQPEQRSDEGAGLRQRQGAAAGVGPAPGPAAAPAGAVAPATPAAAAPAMPAARAPAAQGAAAPASPARARESAGGSAMLSMSRPPLVETWLAMADASAWRRRAPNGEETPLAADWVPEFVAATRGRWTAAPAGTTGSADSVAAREAWTLVQPGGRQVSLIWVTGGVVVCDPQAARCEQARLEEATLVPLRQGLRR